VDPRSVIDVVQKPTQLPVRIGDVAVLGQVDLLLEDCPQQPLG
jgi:hypothetical protein